MTNDDERPIGSDPDLALDRGARHGAHARNWSVDRPVGPEEMQAALRALNGYRRVSDLLVLDRNNDPYIYGTEAHRRNAEWFAEHGTRTAPPATCAACTTG